MADDRATARAALREAMAQWREPLTAIVSLPNKSSVETRSLMASERAPDSDEVLWLPCEGTLDNPAYTTRMEAAELFVLLARVDYSTWKDLAIEWFAETDEWLDFFETRSTLVVGLNYDVFNVHGVRLLCDHIFSSTIRSKQYKTTRALLDEVFVGPLPMVSVRLDYFANDEDDFSELIVEIHDVLSQELPNRSGPINITQLLIERTNEIANQHALDAIASIRSLGIQVINLPIVRVLSWSHAHHTFSESLPGLLGTPSPAVDARPSWGDYYTRPKVPGVERVAVDGSLADVLVPMLFSAIRDSDSVRSVDFDFAQGSEDEESATTDEVGRRRLVTWMTFALFWREPLSTVVFGVETLSSHEVEWMKEVWTSKNPFTVLFPDAIEVPSPCVAQTSSVLLFDPHNSKNAQCQQSRTESTPMALKVVGATRDGFVPLLLPGWGPAWTRENKVTIIPQANRTTRAQSPKHVVLQCMTTESMSAALQLLHLIGRDVQRLELDMCPCGETTLDAFCSEVFTACPNLEDLEVCDAALRSFEFVFEAFRAEQCRRLKHLGLWRIQLHDRHTVHGLFKRLAAPRDPMTSQLRRLRIMPTHTGDTETLAAATAMLAANTRLRDVGLAFRVDAQVKATYENRFQQLTSARVVEPLSSSSILAFLSAATAAQHTSAMHEFDSRILSHILAFAATPRIRSVEFIALNSRVE